MWHESVNILITLHTVSNFILYSQHRKEYLTLEVAHIMVISTRQRISRISIQHRQETISQTKFAHMIVIVNKITIQFRYDVVDIDKMEDISGHDSISIRCRRYLQERGQKVACIIQQIVNTIIIRYR